MNWFRRHIRTGSRLALMVLALQFAVAFGHAHPVHAQTVHAQTISAGVIADAVMAEYGASQGPTDDHDQPQHPSTDGCAICAVLAMTAAALAGASPILHLPDAVTLLHRVTDAGFAHLDPSHAVFQPRAPPAS